MLNKVSSTDTAATADEVVTNLKTSCSTNPEDFYGDGQFTCSKKTGKCKMSCEGTPSHKLVKCKKVPRTTNYNWSPKSASAVKCLPPIRPSEAHDYFMAALESLDITLKTASDKYKIQECRVVKKKLDCQIQCVSAMNCGKKCTGKIPMVQGWC